MDGEKRVVPTERKPRAEAWRQGIAYYNIQVVNMNEKGKGTGKENSMM